MYVYDICEQDLHLLPVAYYVRPDVRNVAYVIDFLCSTSTKIVPLESDLGDVPVTAHKPSKLPLFKKQYENKVFIGKSFQS